jgi:hypothetical protein
MLRYKIEHVASRAIKITIIATLLEYAFVTKPSVVLRAIARIETQKLAIDITVALVPDVITS